MSTAGTEVKVTDQPERQRIRSEVEENRANYGSAYLLPIVVGTLLLLGMLTLGVSVG